MKRKRVLAVGIASLLAASVAAGASARADGRATAAGEPHVIVKLRAVAPAHVTGTVILRSLPAGTRATVEVRRLPPHARATTTLHAGTALPRLSASFTPLPSLKASATGRAKAVAPVRFRGKPVALYDIADGEHAVVVHVGTKVVAFGVVPDAP